MVQGLLVVLHLASTLFGHTLTPLHLYTELGRPTPDDPANNQTGLPLAYKVLGRPTDPMSTRPITGSLLGAPN